MGDLVVVTFLVVNVVFLSVVCVFAVVAACVLVGACVVVTAGEDVAACDVKQTFIVELFVNISTFTSIYHLKIISLEGLNLGDILNCVNLCVCERK